ncbi:DUF3953 domain-containing protein [Priestia filamentosa]|uniref:Uncharacterized protein n=1 Tax=Priestia filamentosa TaxID=1402861 RepID=A0A1X7G3I7_9BACI|nr:DUF3953 domain-containing protein [Priestia filamentosa]AKO92109.1 hypothetical protein BEH_08355 [Priestia filamentosa]MDT3762117.1 DUF3953 domain-containing protein [Priestia filamentosa]OXS65902.1 hypothetical protein B1B01_20860 [Priestia filamentosa]RJS64605.1 DUF3953 domain-containing protein [Priestia filamentosa]WCM17201.1 DUF3953 domain-containing protein [Priestia filamentosa]
MLKGLRVFLSVIVVILSGYSLLTQSFKVMPYSMLLLSALILVTGLIELQKNKKEFWGYLCIVVSLFALSGSIQGFLLN